MDMLSALGFITIITFLALILTKRLSAFTALVIVPIVFALIGGFAPKMGSMILDGIKSVAPTGIMLIFAILYFTLMLEVGLFDPLVSRLLKWVNGDPVKIMIGVAVLSNLVALDGDGATTYMITITAMLPLFKRLGLDVRMLACLASLGMGAMHLTPWGGPTARVMSLFHADNDAVFIPIIPAMVTGLLWTVVVAYIFGKKERKRIGIVSLNNAEIEEIATTQEIKQVKSSFLMAFNFILTVVLIIALIKQWLPLPVLFLTAFSIALIVNFPNPKEHQKMIMSHAANTLSVGSLVFASGVFTGILSGTKMLDAVANTLVSLIPASLGSHLALITGITSMGFTYFMANDPYYFGIIPIIAKTAAAYGINPLEIGRASILGQPLHLLSPLDASIYLLVGMVGIEYSDHLKFSLKWAVGTSMVMVLTALLTGVISF